MRHKPHCTQAGPSGNPGRCFRQSLKAFLDEEAVTSIEYALLASLIAMVILVSVVALGLTLGATWQGVADEVSAATGDGS